MTGSEKGYIRGLTLAHKSFEDATRAQRSPPQDGVCYDPSQAERVHIFYILKPLPDLCDPRDTIHSQAEHVWVIRVCHQWRTIALGCPAF